MILAQYASEWLGRTIRLDDVYTYDYGKVREVRFKLSEGQAVEEIKSCKEIYLLLIHWGYWRGYRMNLAYLLTCYIIDSITLVVQFVGSTSYLFLYSISKYVTMWFMQYLHSTIHFSYRFPFNIFVMFVWSNGTHATMYCTPNVLMILAHSRYTTSEWSIAPFTVWIIWLRIISTTWSQASINDLSSHR